jgi:hypothetical protein
MKRIIKSLIRLAEATEDFDTRESLLEEIRDLINELASTYNAPSNWRDIAEELAEEYKDNNDIYEALRLYEYEQ